MAQVKPLRPEEVNTMSTTIPDVAVSADGVIETLALIEGLAQVLGELFATPVPSDWILDAEFYEPGCGPMTKALDLAADAENGNDAHYVTIMERGSEIASMVRRRLSGAISGAASMNLEIDKLREQVRALGEEVIGVTWESSSDSWVRA
jgi:hypothetical protein